MEGKQEDAFVLFFRGAPVPMLLLERKTGRIREANAAACRFYGRSAEELQAMTFAQLSADPAGEGEANETGPFPGRVWIGRHLPAEGSAVTVEVAVSSYTGRQQELLCAIVHDAGGRALAEARLAESERRLATLLANLPGMAYRCRNDPSWTMEFVSEGCLELTGHPPEHLLRNNRVSYSDLIHPEDRRAVWVGVQEALARRSRFQLTYRLRTAQGEEKWVWEAGQGVFGPSGECLAIEGFITDVTQRRKAEQALRQSEEKFRLAFHTSPDAINLNRLADGLFLDINEGFSRLTGYTRAETIGRTSAELDIWDDPRDRERLIEDLKRQGHVENLEARFRRKSGETGIGLMSARLLNLQGEAVILSITRDITRMREIDRKLQEAERKYRELAEFLPQGIFEIDAEGNLLYLNQKGHALFGYRPEDLASGFHVLEAFSPEDRGRIVDDIRDILEGKKIDPPEYTALRKDGTSFPVKILAGRILRDETPVGLRGVVIDLTEIRQAEEERKRLEIQLQQAQKMEAIGTLAGGVAHDFNNILAVIIGNANLLELSGALSASERACLQQILAASGRARELVKQILAFSRRGLQEKILLNLKPIVKETAQFLKSTLPSSIEIRPIIPTDLPPVLADPTQMQQVLMNLCTNAAHAMENAAQRRLEIRVEPLRLSEEDLRFEPGVEAGHFVRIAVADTGCGIDPRLRDRIFEPYFTTKPPGKGTGLGLAVVHGIVSHHGGFIRIESEPGRGTEIQVYLPAATPLVTEPALRPEHAAIPHGEGVVLFVDDEPALAEMGSQMLARLGYTPETRTSPIEALEAFRSHPRRYRAVVTDLTMPQMNGMQLARRLLEIHPAIPVILCTGFSDQSGEEKARASGIRAFLYKPLTLAELAEALQRVVAEADLPEAP
ncbi:MAG: PAS domain S-box protein [Desulfobacterales bacterium]